MPAKHVAIAGAAVLAIAAVFAGFGVLASKAERGAIAGLRRLTMGDPVPCGSLAAVTEEHFTNFERGYRLVERDFGYGFGHCAARAPNVRYTFAGGYRPHETQPEYVARIARALESDGWRAIAGEPSQAASWTRTVARGTQLSLSLVSYSGELRNKPELVDLGVTASEPIDRADRAPLAEGGDPVERPSLMQMTIFYPEPLPPGIRRVTDHDIAAIQYVLALYEFADTRGRKIHLDERPAPAAVTKPCDALGIVYRNEARPNAACPRAGTTADGLPVYSLTVPSRTSGTQTYYGFIRDDTILTVGRAEFRSPSFDRAEVFALIDALVPANLARKKT